MKNVFRLVTAAASALTILTAPVSAATPDNVLVVAQNIDDIIALDPAQAYEQSAMQYITNVYDRLVQYDAEDTTKLVGGVAESWDIDGEGQSIKFTLRDGISFTSGNPVTAADVAYSFKRVIVLNKNPAFILTQLGWTPNNMDEMVSGEGNVVTVKYDGAFAPSFVMNVLAAAPASILDSKLLIENEIDGDMGNAWANQNSAGTGAYSLQTYRPTEMLRLAANPNYYKGAPKIPQVIIRHVAEPATQLLLLESGDVDIARNLAPEQVASMSSDTLKLETFPQANIYFLSFNQKVPELQNEAVWEASRYLIDYQGLADTVMKGQFEIHQAFWPKGFPGAVNDTPFTYDVEKAKQILADANVELPINVTMDVLGFPPFPDWAQSVQASFAEVGINFELLPGTTSGILSRYRAREHEALLLLWGPDFNDPHSNAKAFAYNSNNSDDGYVSTTTWRNAWAVPEEMNSETSAALIESDPAKREAMYGDLQRQVMAKSPIVVAFQAILQIAMANNVKGYVNGASADLVFYRMIEKN